MRVRGPMLGTPQRTSGWSLALLAGSWLLIAQIDPTLWFLILGITLLDFAVQSVHVSSQYMLTAAYPDRASSVIGAYMAFYSLGSALGAVTTAWAYASWGWRAVCLLGGLYALAGLITWSFTGRAGRHKLTGRISCASVATRAFADDCGT